MGILTTVKSRMKLARLREALERDPSPSAVAELARFHIQLGDEDSARNVVTQGLSRFPRSEILKPVMNFLVKERCRSELGETLRHLEEDPEEEGFRRVVEAYREMGDLDRAWRYVQRWVEHFPSAAEAHRLAGEIRLARFLEDRSARDGAEAVKALLRAMECDPEDPEPVRLLASFFAGCGLTVRARALVENVLEQDPDAVEARGFLEQLSQYPEDDGDPDLRLSEIEAGTFSFRYEFYEVEGEGAEGPSPAPGPGTVDLEEVEGFLDAALTLEDVAAAVFLDREGRCRGVELSEADWEPFGAFVERIGSAARKASLRMDLGAFEQGVIEFPSGGVLLRELPVGIAGFLITSRRGLAKNHTSLSDLVERMAARCGKNDEESAEGTE